MSLICIQECRVYTAMYSWLRPRPREGENVKKSSEQFSGDFSYVRKGLLFQKANLSFQPPRINDTQLRQVRSCHAAINHADRHTKRMLAGGCGKRGNEACVGSESSHDDTRTDVPFPTPVLLGANIHAESAPPYFAHRIQARFLPMCFSLFPIPTVKVLFHVADIVSLNPHATLLSIRSASRATYTRDHTYPQPAIQLLGAALESMESYEKSGFVRTREHRCPAERRDHREPGARAQEADRRRGRRARQGIRRRRLQRHAAGSARRSKSCGGT